MLLQELPPFTVANLGLGKEESLPKAVGVDGKLALGPANLLTLNLDVGVKLVDSPLLPGRRHISEISVSLTNLPFCRTEASLCFLRAFRRLFDAVTVVCLLFSRLFMMVLPIH